MIFKCLFFLNTAIIIKNCEHENWNYYMLQTDCNPLTVMFMVLIGSKKMMRFHEKQMNTFFDFEMTWTRDEYSIDIIYSIV